MFWSLFFNKVAGFTVQPYSQNQKLGFRNLGKKLLRKKISEISVVSEFPTWLQFNVFYYLLYTTTQKQNTETVALSMENVKELF